MDCPLQFMRARRTTFDEHPLGVVESDHLFVVIDKFVALLLDVLRALFDASQDGGFLLLHRFEFGVELRGGGFLELIPLATGGSRSLSSDTLSVSKGFMYPISTTSSLLSRINAMRSCGLAYSCPKYFSILLILCPWAVISSRKEVLRRVPGVLFPARARRLASWEWVCRSRPRRLHPRS